jgi:uncharacterized protein (DUF2237 family)
MKPVSIVIPVKDPPDIQMFMNWNSELHSKENEIIVVDSGGGMELQLLATSYTRKLVPFWEARKIGYSEASTEFILNLDSDVLLPNRFLHNSLKKMEEGADAVSIFYEDVGHCQGALEYGASLWRSKMLRSLYDFSLSKVSDGQIRKVGSSIYSTLNDGWCECNYMWRKLVDSGGVLETIPFRAKHLHVKVKPAREVKS